jgi:hypothetical protein
VFADGGRWTGTIRLPEVPDNVGRFTWVQLVGDFSLPVTQVDAWTLNRAQLRGHAVVSPSKVLESAA